MWKVYCTWRKRWSVFCISQHRAGLFLTRLMATGATERTNTRDPRIFPPPLDAYARRAEKTIPGHQTMQDDPEWRTVPAQGTICKTCTARAVFANTEQLRRPHVNTQSSTSRQALCKPLLHISMVRLRMERVF